MALYTSVTVSNYNLNPPADDGTVSDANKITWSKHKLKIGDPLKTAVEAVNSGIVAMAAKLLAGAAIVPSAVDYAAGASDQGKLIVFTAAGKTLTTPDATHPDVSNPFVFSFQNNSSGDATVDGNGAQTVNGSSAITIRSGGGGFLLSDGSNWYYFGSGIAGKSEFASNTRLIFPQAAAPVGWTQVVDHNDAMLRVVSGAGAGTGGSWTITGLTADPHTHTQQGQFATDSINLGSATNFVAAGSQGLIFNNHGHTTTISGQTGAASANGVSSAGTWRPTYVDVIICKKD